MTPIVPTFEIAKAVPIGRLVLTLPAGRPLPKKGRWTLDHLIAAEADGFGFLASDLMAEFERFLGVTTDDRLVAGSLRNARGIDPDDLERLAQADATVRSPTAPRHMRRDAKRAIIDVKRRQKQRIQRADAAEVERGLAETVALRQARGEPVHVGLAGGKRRASIIGGLHLAYERGVLDSTSISGDGLMRAAELYRDLYEKAVGQRGPDRTENLAMGGVSSGFGPKSMLPQVQADQELRYARDGLTKLQRDTCDQVCGLDRTINEVAREWEKNPRTLEKALAEGLKRVGENRMWW